MKRVSHICTFLGVTGLISSLFLSGLAFGIGVGWQEIYKNNRFFAAGWNPYRFLALTYLTISACFLAFCIFSRVRARVYPKIVCLITMIIILMQSRVLIVSQPTASPEFITEYSSLLESLLFSGAFWLALAILLILAQVLLIWLGYREEERN
jgi:hypothetical protein